MISRKFHTGNKLNGFKIFAVIELHSPEILFGKSIQVSAIRTAVLWGQRPSVGNLLEKLNIKDSLKEKITQEMCERGQGQFLLVSWCKGRMKMRRVIGGQLCLQKPYFECKRMQIS